MKFGPKTIYGYKIYGNVRSTFLIDSNGKILKIWNNIKVKDYALEVLHILKAMKNKKTPIKGPVY
tara:strand:- start:144 stop:338 length:195 start_codon:yes stop_codon:yes gene_type:complete